MITLKCKGCTERHPACHDTCEHYKKWKEEQRYAKHQAESGKFGYYDPARK